MKQQRFKRLVTRGLISERLLDRVLEESAASGEYPEDLLMRQGIPKREIIFCLSEQYHYPVIEYDDEIVLSRTLSKRIDLERLKHALWLPLSLHHNKVFIIAYRPDDPAVPDDIKKTLGVDEIEWMTALPSDIIRIIENNQDLNPGFPPPAGRTPLAKVRTYLADRRSLMACYRTTFAKGRTGLAFLRTGVSFITIAIVLFRIFGTGLLAIPEALLLITGIIATYDGFVWYKESRKAGEKAPKCSSTEATCGSTILEVVEPGDNPQFRRSDPVKGSDTLHAQWTSLSPVMRRRFLASDRTDLAEERTQLACYRTIMARARTGLAFTRTGIAFIGLGIALMRQFHTGLWTIFDLLLILAGSVMCMEGLYWYLPGRSAGKAGYASIRKEEDRSTIWTSVFPPSDRRARAGACLLSLPPVRASHAPGIWATTGLALERTVLAERRNVMARLRTIMARSRTGLAFIRTGMSICAVGAGLQAYFGAGNGLWTVLNLSLIAAGLFFIADGLHWHLPAERTRRQFPYCFGDMEIIVPDYGIPNSSWKKAVFSHDDC